MGGETKESYFCSNYENCFMRKKSGQRREADRSLRRSARMLQGGVTKVTINRKRTAGDIQAEIFF